MSNEFIFESRFRCGPTTYPYDSNGNRIIHLNNVSDTRQCLLQDVCFRNIFVATFCALNLRGGSPKHCLRKHLRALLETVQSQNIVSHWIRGFLSIFSSCRY